MKVGVDVHSLVRLPRGGMHHHAYEIVRSLAEQNPGDRYVLFFDESALWDPTLDRRFIDGLPANCEPAPMRVFGSTPGTAELAWLRWHLPRAAARHRIELFHGFCHTLAHVNKCPSVVTVHDLMPLALLSWTPDDQQANRWRRHLLSAIRRATAICAVSESTRRDVLAVSRSKAADVTIVPNAVRATLTRTRDPDRIQEVATRYQLPDRFFLTIGPDTPRRNYARLIDAVAIAGDTGRPLLPLVIVGARTWTATRVCEQAAARRTGDRVRFLTDVPDDDLSVMYSAASAYVCPSIHEGFCMPVLEAMACGTRVVCSDLPVLHEVAGDAADYFCQTDVDGMAHSLLTASVRPALTDQEQEKLAAKARRFTWSASARTVRVLYERLARRADTG